MNSDKNHVTHFNTHRQLDDTPERERIMRENKTRSVFSLDGDNYRIVPITDDSCTGCAFEYLPCHKMDVPECRGDRRDGVSVIFKLEIKQ